MAIIHPQCKKCHQAMAMEPAQSRLRPGDPLPSPPVVIRTFSCKSCSDEAKDVFYCIHHQETELKLESAKERRVSKGGGVRELWTEYRCTEIECSFKSTETREL